MKKIDEIKNKLQVKNIVTDTNSHFTKPFIPINNNENISSVFATNINKYETITNREILLELDSIYRSGKYSSVAMKIDDTNDTTFFELILKERPIINSIELNGISQINDKTAKEITKSLIGKSYNARVISKNLVKILQLYRKKGIPTAEIKNISFEPNTGKLSISLSENTVNKIKIIGNNETDELVIRREIKIKEGKILKVNDAEETINNLLATNLFEDIEISISKIDSGTNTIIIQD